MIDVDQQRRVTFRMTICPGFQHSIIVKLIELLDICLSCSVIYQEYFLLNILGNKPTKDVNFF